jgi:hypothetical protein
MLQNKLLPGVQAHLWSFFDRDDGFLETLLLVLPVS